jgi:transposase
MLRHMDWMLQSGGFQMYWVDAPTGEIANRRFGRDDLIAFLARRPAGRVALEACGSAHWWARKIRALGHEVVLLHAQFIRPFAQTNKDVQLGT